MPSPLSTIARDRVTAVVGGAYVLIGASNASLGPVGDELRTSLRLSGAVTGLHGASFGWFLLACALGSRVLRRLAPSTAVRAGVAAMVAGLALLASGRHVAVTLLGAATVGAGGAVTVLVAPQLLSSHHGDARRAAAFTYVNALSQIGSIAAPVSIAVALGRGWGWRWVLGAIAVLGGGLVLVFALRTAWPAAGVRDATPGCGPIALLRRHRPVRVRWLALALGISVEFATLFWASAAVQALAGASAAVGAAGVGLFAGGMVVVRLVGPAVVARFDAVAVLLVSFAVAGVASLVLRFGPGVAVRLAALAAMGAGLALVYPVAFARLYGVGVADADVGAIGALASGSAVTFSPLALGALADATSLRWALLVLPALVAAALAAVVVSARGDGGAS